MFSETGLQARIVSQNEIHYQFFQYREDGNYNITRPINSNLMYDANCFDSAANTFMETILALVDGGRAADSSRDNVIKTIYTLQQAIGAALDALPAGRSNQARKINGDLFERLVRFLIVAMKVDCVSGTVQVPVLDENGTELFRSSYQHDLLVSKDRALLTINKSDAE